MLSALPVNIDYVGFSAKIMPFLVMALMSGRRKKPKNKNKSAEGYFAWCTVPTSILLREYI